MDVHKAIRDFKLNTNGNGKRFYGTCDPIPNASELVLTGLLAACNNDYNRRRSIIFFTYDAGPSWYTDLTYQESKNGFLNIEPLSLNGSIKKIEKWIGCKFENLVFEDFIRRTNLMDLTINKLIEEISLRRTYRNQYKVCHIPELGLNDVYNNQKLGDFGDMTIFDLHKNGGWLSGTSIHFVLRIFMENSEETLIAPWNDTGDIFQIYEGSNARFLPCPALYLVSKNASHWGNTIHIQWFGGLLDLWERKKINIKCLNIIKNIFFSARERRIIFEVSEEGIKEY